VKQRVEKRVRLNDKTGEGRSGFEELESLEPCLGVWGVGGGGLGGGGGGFGGVGWGGGGGDTGGGFGGWGGGGGGGFGFLWGCSWWGVILLVLGVFGGWRPSIPASLRPIRDRPKVSLGPISPGVIGTDNNRPVLPSTARQPLGNWGDLGPQLRPLLTAAREKTERENCGWVSQKGSHCSRVGYTELHWKQRAIPVRTEVLGDSHNSAIPVESGMFRSEEEIACAKHARDPLRGQRPCA